ncbi:unnamed protein product [Rotaria socialis]|uniref:Uncharacterized protein n=1 Tax=Rotaria socialis TaxID=392032 RepID=A0A818DRR0_9BILA|nr:unnamed protein product [Rotaria socialis]CAF4289792.1 unnamed protein product [Rotaria socialis]
MNIESSSSEKFVAHPVLDDPAKMMRIIANPVYDKLTISRAAHMRRPQSIKYDRYSTQLYGTKSSTKSTPMKSLNTEQVSTAPLPTKNNSIRSKSINEQRKSPPLHLPVLPLKDEIYPINTQPAIRTRSHSVVSSTVKDDRKSTHDNNTVRYVNGPHGFEIQRHSSGNWLSVDILSKDACEAKERTFREMVELKENDDLVTHSIYTSEYYRKRWRDSLKSCKQGNLTHLEWAEQNYKINCSKKYYSEASQRERSLIELNEQKQRRKRAQLAFKEWKQTKNEPNLEHTQGELHIEDSLNSTDITCVTSNPSLPFNNTNNQTSTPTSTSTGSEELSHSQSNTSTKSTKSVLYMLDEQRWSLQAMLKRIVGLAEPLQPSPPKIINYHNSPLASRRYLSGFESCV